MSRTKDLSRQMSSEVVSPLCLHKNVEIRRLSLPLQHHTYAGEMLLSCPNSIQKIMHRQRHCPHTKAFHPKRRKMCCYSRKKTISCAVSSRCSHSNLDRQMQSTFVQKTCGQDLRKAIRMYMCSLQTKVMGHMLLSEEEEQTGVREKQ